MRPSVSLEVHQHHGDTLRDTLEITEGPIVLCGIAEYLLGIIVARKFTPISEAGSAPTPR